MRCCCDMHSVWCFAMRRKGSKNIDTSNNWERVRKTKKIILNFEWNYRIQKINSHRELPLSHWLNSYWDDFLFLLLFVSLLAFEWTLSFAQLDSFSQIKFWSIVAVIHHKHRHLCSFWINNKQKNTRLDANVYTTSNTHI